MFRSHVGEGAAQRGFGLGLVAGDGLRQVEVEKHRLAVSANKYIGRFDVSMEDAALMRVFQRLGQARYDPNYRVHIVEILQVRE